MTKTMFFFMAAMVFFAFFSGCATTKTSETETTSSKTPVSVRGRF